jgi:hypothetical protein
LEVLGTDIKTDMDNLSGRTDHFTEDITITDKDKEMDNFTTPKTQVSAEDFGKGVFCKDRDNTWRVKEGGSNVFGMKEN